MTALVGKTMSPKFNFGFSSFYFCLFKLPKRVKQRVPTKFPRGPTLDHIILLMKQTGCYDVHVGCIFKKKEGARDFNIYFFVLELYHVKLFGVVLFTV